MSFMGSGADCGPVNPLQSLLKHSERDASGQHDRFQPMPGPSGSQASASMRTLNAGPSSGHADAAQFFAGAAAAQAGPSSASPAAAHPFAMDAMQRELAAFHHRQELNGSRAGSGAGTPGSAEWAKQFSHDHSASPAPQMMHRPSAQQAADAWRQAYLSSPAAPEQQQQQQHLNSPQYSTGYAQPAAMYSGMAMGASQIPFFQQPGFGAAGGMASYTPYQPAMQQQQSYTPAQVPTTSSTGSKGKGRFVELDDNAWEAQFAKLSEATQEDNTAQAPAPFQDDQVEDRDAVREAEDETDQDFLANLERTWKNLKDTLDTSSLDDKELAAWEAQYGTNFADLHGGDYDYDETANDYSPAKFDEWLKEATSKPYPFTEEQDNPFINTFDPFAEGQRLLREGHPLSEAALAFEAACKQNEYRGEAWKALGDTLAADEKELRAIKALERAVSCPDGGGEGAWMSLAISYVNEGQDMRAFSTLEKWITTTYPSIVSSIKTETEESRTNPWAISNRIVEMFLAAARAGPAARGGTPLSAAVDPDVQSGLGVLFYTNSDYTRARDCFEAALSVRPDDFLLWNRLGATLANGGQPEEAIDAYRRALELRPTFTRAIYNLGVSCLNINCFHEAAEHLLAALDLHRKDLLVGKGKGVLVDAEGIEQDDGSENLWHTLRRAFLCMDRPDLADRARPGADVASFRRDGFDF